MVSLAEAYHLSIQDEMKLTPEQLKTRHIGKRDPKRHLEEQTNQAMQNNIVQTLGVMINSKAF